MILFATLVISGVGGCEGGGVVIVNMAVYDVYSKKHIFDIQNFNQHSSRIGFGGNFFHFILAPARKGERFYYVIDPHIKKLYAIDRLEMVGVKAFLYDSMYGDRNDPESKLLSWDKDFEVIDFENYKQ